MRPKNIFSPIKQLNFGLFIANRLLLLVLVRSLANMYTVSRIIML
jgi:hypothetical protein